MAERLTGKASYFVFNGQQIPITKVGRKVERKKADTTDNGDYSASADLLFPTQLIVSATTTFSVEGRYRKSVNPGLNAAAIYESNPGGLLVFFGLDLATAAGHGYFDIENYDESAPIDDTVTYTMDMCSNGPFTPNS